MHVTFFGVRGSCPCSGAEYRRIGGNTSCTLVSVDGEPPLVLDLGTGMRALGEVLRRQARREGRPLHAQALLTHLHFDHILGLPFFAPLHDPGARLTVYGPPQEREHLREALAGAVQPPFFPVKMVELSGEIDVREVGGPFGGTAAGPLDSSFMLGRISARATRVPHPGSTLGFRIEGEGKALVYLPDHQAPLDRETVPDDVRALCEGADLLLHDAQYSDDEFASKPDWGHSTVAYALRVAAESGVRRLLLFHHDPSHTDRDVAKLLRGARRLADACRVKEVSVASEGSTVVV